MHCLGSQLDGLPHCVLKDLRMVIIEVDINPRSHGVDIAFFIDDIESATFSFEIGDFYSNPLLGSVREEILGIAHDWFWWWNC